MAIVQKDSLACLLALFEDFKSKNIFVVFLLTFFEYRKMNTEYRIPNTELQRMYQLVKVKFCDEVTGRKGVGLTDEKDQENRIAN